MDLTLSPVEREFRDSVRGWIENNHPGHEPAGDPEAFEFRRAWQKALNDRGWAGLSWPTEYGGAGATLVEQAIFYEEVARAGAPQMANVLGLAMGGPTVIAHGTEEQKQRFLAPILSADEIWCQGFSEPGSGSDLASLKTRAVRNGDEWVVTGQKVWTTYAHQAKWCMLVARTEPPPSLERSLADRPGRGGGLRPRDGQGGPAKRSIGSTRTRGSACSPPGARPSRAPDDRIHGPARTAHASNQTIRGIDSRASRQPAGLARHARSIRPRTHQA